MYHDRLASMAAFKHQTAFLNMPWNDDNRRSVLSSLYVNALKVSKIKNTRTNNIASISKKKVGDNPNKKGKRRSPFYDYLPHSKSLGVTIAITMYKECQIKRIEKLFLNTLTYKTRGLIESHREYVMKIIQSEVRKSFSLGVDINDIRHNYKKGRWNLPKRLVNSAIRRGLKKDGRYKDLIVSSFVIKDHVNYFGILTEPKSELHYYLITSRLNKDVSVFHERNAILRARIDY